MSAKTVIKALFSRTWFVAILLFGCAMWLVTSQYEARKLFMELERAQARTRELDVTWSQLELEQSTLAKSARISSIAQTDLQMTETSSSRVEYLVPRGRK